MAKFTPSTIVSQVSGKLGGSVFLSGKAKAVIRKKVVGRRKTTRIGHVITENFIPLARAWRSLTDTQQKRWIAVSPEYPTIDRFGRVVILNGMQLYIKLNGYVLLSGNDALSLPLPPRPFTVWNFISITADAPNTLTIQFTPGAFTGNFIFLLHCSIPVSPGRTTIRDNELKFCIATSAGVAGTFNIRNAYIGRIAPYINSEGKKIFMRLQQLNRTTGQVSPGIIRSVIVS